MFASLVASSFSLRHLKSYNDSDCGGGELCASGIHQNATMKMIVELNCKWFGGDIIKKA